MTLEEILLHLKVDGWCVIEEVIPKDKVDELRESVAATTAAEGVQGGSKGLGYRPGIIAFNQSFVPYLSDSRLLGAAEALFGRGVKITSASSIINMPGNERGKWHSDTPFNQHNDPHIPAPYPDAVLHLTSLWMFSPFSYETGGTLIVPGSHRASNNPTGDNGVDLYAPYPTEMNAAGSAGSALLFDSRLWHATASNLSDKPRVGMTVRYGPWWLNLDSSVKGSAENQHMEALGMITGGQPPLSRDIYDSLPEDVRPLLRHWVIG